MKILVVDDEMDVKDLFLQRFRKEIKNDEIQFAFAFSGEDAFKYMNETEHEAVLILSDICLLYTSRCVYETACALFLWTEACYFSFRLNENGESEII